jgi:hypothetical protein
MSFALTAVVVGTGANVAGGMISRNDALSNAQSQANARNASLAKNIGVLQGFGQDNRNTFDANMANYTPAAQQTQLTNAQDARSNSNVANITQETGADAPIAADASPASRSDLAKRMLSVYDGATTRAKALGKLGGYSDAWTQNMLDNAQAGRDIGVTNNYAEGRKALVGPEGDMAAAAAYKPPSIWGPLLQGAGSIASAAGGAGLGGGGFAGATGVNASQIGTPSLWGSGEYVGPLGYNPQGE